MIRSPRIERRFRIRKTDLPPRLQPTLWLTPSLAKAPFISLEVRRLLRAPYSTPFKCKHTIQNLQFLSKNSTCKVVNWIFEPNLTEDFEFEIQTRLKSLSVHKREHQYEILHTSSILCKNFAKMYFRPKTGSITQCSGSRDFNLLYVCSLVIFGDH